MEQDRKIPETPERRRLLSVHLGMIFEDHGGARIDFQGGVTRTLARSYLGLSPFGHSIGSTKPSDFFLYEVHKDLARITNIKRWKTDKPALMGECPPGPHSLCLYMFKL